MNIESLRRIRNSERAKLKNSKYSQKQEKKKQNALHSTINHTVNNFKKTNFQSNVLNKLKPVVYKNKKTGKLIYKRKNTIEKIYHVLSYILTYGSPKEVREILQLREFVRNSAETRQRRDLSKRLYHDPQKLGHNIARQFEYDRLNIFNYFFPETYRLVFN